MIDVVKTKGVAKKLTLEAKQHQTRTLRCPLLYEK